MSKPANKGISKLSLKDKKRILGFGYDEIDLYQIETALNVCKLTRQTTVYEDDNYHVEEKPVTVKEAKELLGDEDFFSGLCRAAFHWDSARDINNNSSDVIYFDMSEYFSK